MNNNSLEEHLKLLQENMNNPQCEHCGRYGFIGKELIRHNKGKKDERILCHACHIKIHQLQREVEAFENGNL